MEKVVKFRRRRNDICTREARLRLKAKKLGYELVRPWCAEQRNIPGHGPYLLVPHKSGFSLAEVEETLRRYRR